MIKSLCGSANWIVILTDHYTNMKLLSISFQGLSGALFWILIVIPFSLKSICKVSHWCWVTRSVLQPLFTGLTLCTGAWRCWNKAATLLSKISLCAVSLRFHLIVVKGSSSNHEKQIQTKSKLSLWKRDSKNNSWRKGGFSGVGDIWICCWCVGGNKSHFMWHLVFFIQIIFCLVASHLTFGDYLQWTKSYFFVLGNIYSKGQLCT